MGLPYKKNVDDPRPALTIMDLLEKRGAEKAYHDPYLLEIPQARRYSRFAGRRSIALDPAEIAAFDAVLIVTDHDNIDYAGLVRWPGWWSIPATRTARLLQRTVAKSCRHDACALPPWLAEGTAFIDANAPQACARDRPETYNARTASERSLMLYRIRAWASMARPQQSHAAVRKGPAV
jgi:UDP-glucose/GDP-mannose dehydrogenase family, UDP binding domain